MLGCVVADFIWMGSGSNHSSKQKEQNIILKLYIGYTVIPILSYDNPTFQLYGKCGFYPIYTRLQRYNVWIWVANKL
jgi:hypothetical protein